MLETIIATKLHRLIVEVKTAAGEAAAVQDDDLAVRLEKCAGLLYEALVALEEARS